MKTLIYACLLICAVTATVDAQSLQISQQLSPKILTVGDELHYEQIATVDANISLYPPIFKDNVWGTFVIKTPVNRSVTDLKNGQKRIRHSFKVTQFKVGEQTWPTLNVRYKVKDKLAEFTLLPMQVTVKSTLPTNAIPVIRGETPPLQLEYAYARQFLILGLLIVLGAVLAFLMFRRFKKPKDSIQQSPPDTRLPDERLMAEIKLLYDKKLLEKQKAKLHYIKLTELFKSYLSQIYQQELLERTTHETIKVLHQHKMDKETLKRVGNILKAADFVKYAKYEMPSHEHDEIKEKIIEVVTRTKGHLKQGEGPS